jgi:hypothetical protein
VIVLRTTERLEQREMYSIDVDLDVRIVLI